MGMFLVRRTVGCLLLGALVAVLLIPVVSAAVQRSRFFHDERDARHRFWLGLLRMLGCRDRSGHLQGEADPHVTIAHRRACHQGMAPGIVVERGGRCHDRKRACAWSEPREEEPMSIREVRSGDRSSVCRARLVVRALVVVLVAWVLMACAPVTVASIVELEVEVATDCEVGRADVVVVVDGVTFTFEGLALTEAGDAELPSSGVVRVPARRGGHYRVTVTNVCDDHRRMGITTYLVAGGERTSLAQVTARLRGQGQVASEGTM